MSKSALRTPNSLLRQQRLLRGWSLSRVAEELRLICENEQHNVGVSSNMIWKWEQGKHLPSPLYQAAFCRLYQRNADQLGFLTSSSPESSVDGRSQAFKESSHLKEASADVVRNEGMKATMPSTVQQEHGTIRASINDSLLSLPDQAELQSMNKSRRTFLQHTASTIPAFDLFTGTLLERLARVLTHPSSVDATTLHFLEKHTEYYWQVRQSAGLASFDLFDYVYEHLQKVTGLLEGSLLPSARKHLCAMVGEIALLAGELFYDMKNYLQARHFFSIAIQAAREADNQALQAVAWGRLSFTWTYDEKPEQALICLQEARHVAIGHANITICTWLAAVEAEIHANLHNYKACMKALNETKDIQENDTQRECYWIHFDPSLLAGYRGVCFLQLSHSEHSQRASLLKEAQGSLKNALALLDPSLTRRKTTLLTDLAGTYLQQQEIEAACDHALQSIAVISQIKSQVSLQRLQTLRNQLIPWNDTVYVRNLDEYLMPLVLNWS